MSESSITKISILADHLQNMREQEEALVDEVAAQVERERGFAAGFVLLPGYRPEPCPSCRNPISTGETLFVHGEDQTLYCEACFDALLGAIWTDRLLDFEPEYP